MLLPARYDVRKHGELTPRSGVGDPAGPLTVSLAWWGLACALALASVAPIASAQGAAPRRGTPSPGTPTDADGGAAPAASPTPAPPTREARQAAAAAYARGQQAYANGDFQAAEAAFLEAYAAVPNPVVLVGVGESRDARGDVVGAVAAFEQYLAERPRAPDTTAIQARITALRGRIGRLALTSTPSGAEILIDDAPTEHVTPAEITLPAGSHAVALRLEGYVAHAEAIDVQPGEEATALEVTLDPVVVEPEPEPAVEAPITEDLEREAEPTEGYASEPTGPAVVTWLMAGIAAAGVASGTVLGFLALSEEGDFNDGPTAGAADRGERYALFADVAFGIGAAAAITTLVLYFVRDHDQDVPATDHARVRVSPVASTREAGLRAEVQF
jgi:hypothetical protein